MEHRAGFVNIIGNPNVGKSTLMNVLVGERLSVITSKAQTTRHRILGIVNGDDYQVVYSDTPGVLEPKYMLHQSMMAEVLSAMEDADIFLLVTEMDEPVASMLMLDKINESGVPTIILINKIDLSDQASVIAKVEAWAGKIEKSEVLPISAKENFNVDVVFQRILELLPESSPYYAKEDLTDRSERFFVSEIIRGKILEIYKKEVPYCTEVAVETFEDEENLLRIRAAIYVTRDSQKAILIGDQGKAIKKLGTTARFDLEKFFDKHIYLDLVVKVSKDWRDDKTKLKRFGYQV